MVLGGYQDLKLVAIEFCTTSLKLEERVLNLKQFNPLEGENSVFETIDLSSSAPTLRISSAVDSSTAHRVIGMYFFSPANFMRLVEVVKGEKACEDTICRIVD